MLFIYVNGDGDWYDQLYDKGEFISETKRVSVIYAHSNYYFVVLICTCCIV